VAMMNAQAKAWGAPGIHFANPDGLPNPHHVVTALGMAIIAEHAMRNPIFRHIVATKVSSLPPDPTPRIYYNQNQLLFNYPGAVGIKIGYTIEADETIVGAARRHGQLVIVVLLHDTPAGLWPDVEHLLTWGLTDFRPLSAVHKGQLLGALSIGHRRVTVKALRTVTYLVPQHSRPRISWQLTALRPLDPRPLVPGTIVGRAAIRVGPKVVGRIPVVNARRIPSLPPTIHWIWWWLGFPALVAVSLAIPRGRRRPSVVLGEGDHTD
jgi:D-alanyl-D-alanine carboxypeptidase (penicillin-binding protein 5/6)